MEQKEALFNYLLRLGDNAAILGHRLSEWCGHGPELEEDIAIINTALDLLGHARSLYSYAGQVEGKGRDEDDIAYLRIEREYRNNSSKSSKLTNSPVQTFCKQFQTFLPVFRTLNCERLSRSQNFQATGSNITFIREGFCISSTPDYWWQPFIIVKPS